MFFFENTFYTGAAIISSFLSVSYFIYNEFYRISNLKQEIESFKIDVDVYEDRINFYSNRVGDLLGEIIELKNKIKSLPNSEQIEWVMDTNVINWNFLMAKTLFNLYQDNGFGDYINFSQNKFDDILYNKGLIIENLNSEAQNVINTLFLDSPYHNICTNNYDIVKYETDIYISKLRFFLSDTTINNLMIENNFNNFNDIIARKINNEFDEYSKKSNLIRVLEHDKIVKPYSLDIRYIKQFNVNNAFKKPIISEFNN